MNDTPKITAPWDHTQVEALNNWQRAGHTHPYTCGNEHEGCRDLVATKAGWICVNCDYTQDWAHEASAYQSSIPTDDDTPWTFLRSRAARLARLAELEAPFVIIEREMQLVLDAYAKVARTENPINISIAEIEKKVSEATQLAQRGDMIAVARVTQDALDLAAQLPARIAEISSIDTDSSYAKGDENAS